MITETSFSPFFRPFFIFLIFYPFSRIIEKLAPRRLLLVSVWDYEIQYFFINSAESGRALKTETELLKANFMVNVANRGEIFGANFGVVRLFSK